MTALVLSSILVAGCDGGDDQEVGPRGGVVTSDDGRITLTIPPGALAETLSVSIEQVDEGPDGAIGQTYVIEPQFTQLGLPAMIEVDLEAKDEGIESLDLDAAMDDLSLVTENADGWRQLADHDVDADTGLITGSVMFFGTYALVTE